MNNFGVFAPFRWANRKNVLILTYQRFSNEKTQATISAEEFELHLNYLSKNNCVLPLSDIIDKLEGGRTLPPNTTAITIDDGYRDSYEIAFPLLKKFGIPATVYAITDFLDGKIWVWTDLMRYVLVNTKCNQLKLEFDEIDKIKIDLTDKLQRLETATRINSRLKKLPNEQRDEKIQAIAGDLNVKLPEVPPADFAPLDWNEACEMDRENIKIESHTVTHPILPNLSAEQIDFEIKCSKNRLEEMLGRRVEHFCYPNGSLNENALSAAGNAGYKSAVTTIYGFNDAQTNLHLLHRIDAQSAIENFAQSVSGFEALRNKF